MTLSDRRNHAPSRPASSATAAHAPPGRFGLLILLALATLPAGCAEPPTLRVMSFNIRYGTAPDAENRWLLRRDLLVRTIRAYDPDVLGLQEVIQTQFMELHAAFDDYDLVAVGRDDGNRGGEMVPIAWRKSRLRLVETGHFWLSPTRHTPSHGWDAALPRVVTFVRLELLHPPRRQFVVVNTHFDHRGRQARLESARMLREFVETIGDQPVILMGDFNCGPQDEPYALLTAPDAPAPLLDAWTACNKLEEYTGTYHAFRGRRDGRRIDWILFSPHFAALDAAIDTTSDAGRYPSDHFPVTAELRLVHKTRPAAN